MEFNSQEFKSPSARYRGKPLWCWNGKLKKVELLRQLKIFKTMGFGGFFMHSRTGLATEYLGEEWFELINACADEAEEFDLEPWLYDEDRWPSGSAGGMATDDPSVRMKYLRLTICKSSDEVKAIAGSIAAVFKGRVSGVEVRDIKRLDDWSAFDFEEASLLIFTHELMVPHPFFNGNTYLDTLNRAATERFIELTHRRYKSNCGNRLGKGIKGIFTDEPHHGMVLCKNVQHNYQEDEGWVLPWTEHLPEAYSKNFDQNIIDMLPELFLQKDGIAFSPVKWRYMEVLQQLFLSNWAQPLREASNGMNLTLTGHVLHEDTLSAQVIPCGSLMRYYEHLDCPGVDVLGAGNENFWLAKPAQSASRQQGKPWIMSELYGCTGWDMGFEGHKRIGDWQAMFGINIRSHHLCWYSMAGESKRDYPASLFFQSPWFEDYAIIEDYFARLGYVLQRGQAYCELLVLNPVESVASQVYVGWAKWMGSNSSAVDRLEREYEQLFRVLTNAQIDYDYGDEDQIDRWAEVIDVNGEPRLKLGSASYRYIVIYGVETMRASTLEVFKKFKDAGGHVYFLGEAPGYLDAEPSGTPSIFAERCLRFAKPSEKFIQELASKINAPVQVLLIDEVDGSKTPLLSHIRKFEEGWIVVLMNTQIRGDALNVEIHLSDQKMNVEELDCRKGGRYIIDSERRGTNRVVSAQLEPLCELVLIATNAKQSVCELNPRHTKPFSDVVTLEDDSFLYDLDEPNICVLDKARFKLGEGSWIEAEEIVRLDEYVRRELGLPQRNGEMHQPWASEPHGEVCQKTKLTLEFEFNIDAHFEPEALELLMEQPDYWRVELNGCPITTSQDDGWFIDPCFRRLTLPDGILKSGRNVIRLETEFCHHVDLEAIYLLGNFAVSLGEQIHTLSTLPAHLSYGSIVEQGLPFYSGKLFYHVAIPKAMRSSAVLVDMEGCFAGAFAKLCDTSGEAVASFAMPPYRDVASIKISESNYLIEVCLTRRNSFGPFHQVPSAQGFVAPSSFRSKGREYTDGYVLVPAGLIHSPRFSLTKLGSNEAR